MSFEYGKIRRAERIRFCRAQMEAAQRRLKSLDEDFESEPEWKAMCKRMANENMRYWHAELARAW